MPAFDVALSPLEPVPDSSTVPEVRADGAIAGLPTDRPQMIAFLRHWLLARPDHSLDLIERLTPARLDPAPLLANTYCRAAEVLVRYDLGGAR